MRTLFNISPIFNCDCYVADYSELTNNNKKVVISTVPFTDISYFHFHKKRKQDNIPYLAVNLEEYPHLIKGSENCECVFQAISDIPNTWIMLLELKYCKAENTETYGYKAYSQMDRTLSLLEKWGCADRHVNNVYFVYSVPEHPEKEPFGAWTLSQNDTLKGIEASGIHMLGYCRMLIATPRFLFPPKIRE